jgi:hypothetical protein
MTELSITLPSSVARRVGQLVRLFASSRDGEVLASVRALGRTLSQQGLDFNALADVLEDGLGPRPMRALPPVNPSRSGDSVAIARQCWRRHSELSQRERRFVGDMMHVRQPTESQMKWLIAIARRLRDSR